MRSMAPVLVQQNNYPKQDRLATIAALSDMAMMQQGPRSLASDAFWYPREGTQGYGSGPQAPVGAVTAAAKRLADLQTQTLARYMGGQRLQPAEVREITAIATPMQPRWLAMKRAEMKAVYGDAYPGYPGVPSGGGARQISALRLAPATAALMRVANGATFAQGTRGAMGQIARDPQTRINELVARGTFRETWGSF